MVVSRPAAASPMPGLLAAALALAAVAVAWWWLGRPAEVPPSPLAAGEKIACLSYAPFEGAQTPFDPTLVVPPEQIERQIAALSEVTGCLRTYTVSQGLEAAPAAARRHGLKLLLGVWLGRERDRNAAEIDRAIALAGAYPDVVRGIVVGNEVLLRRDLPKEALRAAIDTVKAGVTVPITYADVWEFWERNTDLAEAVDFVTVHILPYWEDDPVGVIGARDHVAEVRRHLDTVFPGKAILIGETGWPSAGRMREDALPSPANQVRYLTEIIALATANGWDYNLIEAKDQPWKRRSEGTVGGHWGILTDGLGLKFHWGEPISDMPEWRLQAAGGLAAAVVVLAAGFGAIRRRPVALAVLAFAAGMALPWWAVEIPLVSLDAWDWTFAAATLALAAVAAVAGARALARDATRPVLATTFGSAPAPRGSATFLGWILAAALAIAAATALAILADPRYRDFTTAAFVVPAVVAILVAPARGPMRAERLAAALLAVAAVGIGIQEGPQNLQALAFAAVTLAFAAGLRPWRRGV